MELTGAAHSLARVLENKIISRLKEIPKLREQAFKQLEADFPGKTRKELGLIWLKQNELPAYRTLKRLSGEVKQLNRSLGGLLTTDPEFYADEGLFDDILKYDLDSSQLAARLKEFGGKTANYNKKFKGKVGHHGTALSTLREFLKNKAPSWRREFKKIALENGYEIGEEFIKYIDPAAHKAFGDNVTGILSKRGINRVDNPEIFQALSDRFAHSWWSGASKPFEKGFSASPVLSKGKTPLQAFKNVIPNLEIDKLGTDYGLELDRILTKFDQTVFPPGVNPADELLKSINRLPIPDDMARGIISAGTKINIREGLIDPTTGKKLTPDKDIMNVLSSGWQTIFKENSAAARAFQAAYKNPVVKAGGAILSSTVRTIAKPIDPLFSGINIYNTFTAKDQATRAWSAYKSLEHGTGFAAWFTPKAITPALIMAGASTIAESQDPTKIQEVTGEKDWQTPVVPGAVTPGVIPVGAVNPFTDWFTEGSDTKTAIQQQQQGD